MCSGWGRVLDCGVRRSAVESSARRPRLQDRLQSDQRLPLRAASIWWVALSMYSALSLLWFWMHRSLACCYHTLWSRSPSKAHYLAPSKLFFYAGTCLERREKLALNVSLKHINLLLSYSWGKFLLSFYLFAWLFQYCWFQRIPGIKLF